MLDFIGVLCVCARLCLCARACVCGLILSLRDLVLIFLLNWLLCTDAHKKCNHFILSTSTLNAPYLTCGCFGPVNDDCYAIGYGLRSDTSDFIIGSYRGDESDMVELSARALEDMVAILDATS